MECDGMRWCDGVTKCTPLSFPLPPQHKGKATDAYLAATGFPIEDMKERTSGRTVFQGCCNCDWDLPAPKVVTTPQAAVKEAEAAADTKPAGEL